MSPRHFDRVDASLKYVEKISKSGQTALCGACCRCRRLQSSKRLVCAIDCMTAKSATEKIASISIHGTRQFAQVVACEQA